MRTPTTDMQEACLRTMTRWRFLPSRNRLTVPISKTSAYGRVT